MPSAPKFSATLKQPDAFLPIAMSLAALVLVRVHITFFGIAREADEGAVAHIFQFLMAGQAPIVAIFLVRWLARAPRAALATLALQVGAALLALAPVYFLHL